MESQLREATIADLDTLISLRLSFLTELEDIRNEEERQQLEQILKRYLARALLEKSFVCWLVEVEGEVVATGGMNFFERAPMRKNLTGREAYILNIYTVPEWRGHGFARLVFAKLLEHAREQGIVRIGLHATEDGRQLYEKFGFRPDSTGMEIWIYASA